MGINNARMYICSGRNLECRHGKHIVCMLQWAGGIDMG
jgi:hypothetical protein